MAQRFRTDLKDEIVEGGIKFWRAVSSTGTKLLDNFKMERANGNTQEGSSFGAKEANAIHEFLNGLLDGEETVKNADNANKLSNLGYGSGGLPYSENALNIDLNGNKNGKIEYVDCVGNNSIQCPIESMLAIKKQYVLNSSFAVVELHEILPEYGRIWTNTFDNKVWRGWKNVSNEGNADTVDGFGFNNSPASGTPSYVPGWPGGTPTNMDMYKPENWTVNNSKKMSALGYGDVLPFSPDTLQIYLDGSRNGKIEIVNSHSESTKNCPIANFIGTKVQYVMNSGWANVVLYEMHPVPGRIWRNDYNQTWMGWKNVSDGGNASKFGGQLPTYFAKASQLSNVAKLAVRNISVNPAGNNYFDVSRASNESIIPLGLYGGNNYIEAIQYGTASARVIMNKAVSSVVTFYYLVVT